MLFQEREIILIEAYKKFWKNYTNFEGKTNRKDYWLTTLAHGLILLIPTILVIFLFISIMNSTYDFYYEPSIEMSLSVIAIFVLIIIYCLAIFVGNLALQIRRLRDAGFHWAFIFMNFIPYVGGFVMLILFCMPSKNLEEDLPNIVVEKSIPEQLVEWRKLLDDELITQEEYEKKKAELLER